MGKIAMVLRFSKSRIPYEADEQRAYFEWVDIQASNDWRYLNIFHVPNGAHLARGAKTLFFLKQIGLRPGIPDIIVSIPSYNGSPEIHHGLFIEMKRLGNEPTARQNEWRKRLIKAHYGYCLAHSALSAMEITERWIRDSPIIRDAF